MIRERLEELADCLLLGLFVALTALPVVTAPSGFAAACRVLAIHGPPRAFFTALRHRWREPVGELGAGLLFAAVSVVLLLDVMLAATVLPASPWLRLAVVCASVAGGAMLIGIAARAGANGSGWREALRMEPPRPMLMAVLVVSGVLVWALPPLALVISGPLALAAVAR